MHPKDEPYSSGLQGQHLPGAVLGQVEAGEAGSPSRVFETVKFGLSKTWAESGDFLACSRRSPLACARPKAAWAPRIPSDLGVLVVTSAHLAVCRFSLHRYF